MAGLTENRLSVCKHFFPADIKRISQGTWLQATDRPWLSCAKGKVLKGCGGFRAVVGLEGQAWKIEPAEGAWEGWAAGSTARLQREHAPAIAPWDAEARVKDHTRRSQVTHGLP